MQNIHCRIIYRSTPDELLNYFNTHNLDFNKPINIEEWIGETLLPSILYAFRIKIDRLDYYKRFIEAGADVNVKGVNCYEETLFEYALDNNKEDVLELFLPHFKLKYNKDIMYSAYLCLKNREYHTPKFIRLVEDLISKFDKKKWIKKMKQFQTDLRYTAKTSAEYPD